MRLVFFSGERNFVGGVFGAICAKNFSLRAGCMWLADQHRIYSDDRGLVFVPAPTAIKMAVFVDDLMQMYSH
jgi:hypothetical protein